MYETVRKFYQRFSIQKIASLKNVEYHMTYMQSQIMFLQPDINGFYSASRLSIVILSPQKKKN